MNCVLCEEVITNPLCPGCLHDEVQQWLLEECEDRLVHQLQAVTSSLSQSGETHCIKCNSEMAVCTYCYTRDVFDLIKHDHDLLAQYMTYFNFDLGHMGWEREARARLNEVV